MRNKWAQCPKLLKKKKKKKTEVRAITELKRVCNKEKEREIFRLRWKGMGAVTLRVKEEPCLV